MCNIIFWGSGEIFHVFKIDFQASTGKKLREKKHRKLYGTCEFDVKHSAVVCTNFMLILQFA